MTRRAWKALSRMQRAKAQSLPLGQEMMYAYNSMRMAAPRFSTLQNDVFEFIDRVRKRAPGFERYYEQKDGKKKEAEHKKTGDVDAAPKAEEPHRTSRSAYSKSNDSKDKGEKTSFGGGPGGDMRSLGLYFIAFLVLSQLFSSRSNSSIMNDNHISFQEFVNEYLATGRVKRMYVVNKSFVRAEILPEGPKPKEESIDMDSSFPDFEEEDTRAPASIKSSRLNVPKRVMFEIGSVDSFERNVIDAQNMLNVRPADRIPIEYRDEVELENVFSTLLSYVPTMLLLFLGYQMLSGLRKQMGSGPGGMMGFKSMGQSKTNPKDIKTRFKDVAGLESAKVEIMEFVQFLKDPSKFTKLGAKIPKGALLVGPPGTGKTLLARATAGEAGVPFYSISGSDFVEMFVGVGSSRVRDLFKQARKDAPSIIFIDEIDAVGRKRSENMRGGNDERENTLNQLLVEMDGFRSDTGVVVLAGTNRADILDSALTRAGRFDRQIQMNLPDIKERKEIFMVHLKPIKVRGDREEIARMMASQSPGMAGSDIANICNEAALIAARSSKDAVELKDFESAMDRVIAGLENNKLLSKDEKKRVAYHEAGHAVVGWMLEHASPLVKVTIVPRSKGSLGFAQYLPKETSLYTPDQIVDTICMTLGGRASEKLFMKSISTGASDDLQKVTQIAYSYVATYGMNPNLSNLNYQSMLENAMFKPYSESTSAVIDKEVKDLIETCYQRTLALLETHSEKVLGLGNALIEKETLNHEELVKVLGPRAHSTQEYEDYVNRKSGELSDAVHEPVVDAVTQEDDSSSVSSTTSSSSSSSSSVSDSTADNKKSK